MVHRSSLVVGAAVATAIGLMASWGAAVEPTLTIPGAASSPPPVERLSDEQVTAELRRLNVMKLECTAQAQQALAAQQSASVGGRTAEAEAHAQNLRTKMTCVDQVTQGVLRLRTQATRDQLRLFSLQDGFHQEYRQGLQSHLNALQYFSKQVTDQSALTAETFAAQMETFRRQREIFKNRYIRLLNDPETRELATTVFQAGDLLIGSAQVWMRQVKADAEIAALTPNGPSLELSRAQAAREVAITERDRQWEMAQGLILRATALAATH